MLSTPTGRQAQVGSSELIRRIDERLRIDTSFSLTTLPAELVKTCRGRLGCLALKSRPDYVPNNLVDASGRPLPFREYVRRLKASRTRYTRYLLVVSNVTLPGRADRLSAALVDTDIALEMFHEARRDLPEWEDRFEARVDAGALAGPTATGQVRTADDVTAFFERFLGTNVRERLERTRHWRPYGRVRIDTPVPHVAISWDGRTVGSTMPGATQLVQARAGQHELTLAHPDFEPVTRTVKVVPGETTVVPVTLERKPNAGSGRPWLLWSGVGLVAVGSAISVYALTQQDGDATTVCIGADCPSGAGFQTTGYQPTASASDEINPPGLLLGPLGYSIAATGAVWSLGTLLSDEDVEFPWLPLVLGLVVGGASYGVSVAADGP